MWDNMTLWCFLFFFSLVVLSFHETTFRCWDYAWSKVSFHSSHLDAGPKRRRICSQSRQRKSGWFWFCFIETTFCCRDCAVQFKVVFLFQPFGRWTEKAKDSLAVSTARNWLILILILIFETSFCCCDYRVAPSSFRSSHLIAGPKRRGIFVYSLCNDHWFCAVFCFSLFLLFHETAYRCWDC